MRILPRGVAPRLILALLILVAVVEAIFAVVSFRQQERQLLDEKIEGVDQLSRSITSATWHAMMANQPEATHQIMQTISEKHGIESLRFFNKEGRVTFSTDSIAARQVDKNAESCFLCHAREEALVRVDMPSRARIFQDANGRRKLAMVTPIYNEPACSNAPCHAHPADQSVLGVLDVALDLASVDRQLAGIKNRALLVTLVQVGLVGLLIALFTRHFVSRPIRRLIAGTRAVSAMNLHHRINIGPGGELSELAASFNLMQERLREAMEQINAFTQDLESQVEERTRQLVVAEKKLIQSDRLASLGQLSASVAHEINNPISGVLNYAVLMQRLLKEDGIPPERVEDFRRYLAAVSDETARVGRIVTDLLAFSRRRTPRMSNESLNDIVRKTIPLISHKLELGGVNLNLLLEEALPQVHCDASQMQQVVINLVMNAAEASSDGDLVVVQTRSRGPQGEVALSVQDFGTGIRPDHLKRIFDPFFSTKDEGKGVGLGLAVVYGIVEAHGGRVDVESQPGEGTTFTIVLPLANWEEKREEGGVGSAPTPPDAREEVP